MNHSITDTVSALRDIRRLAETGCARKDGSLEWQWADGEVRYRRQPENGTDLRRVPVRARVVAGEAEYTYLLREAPGGTEGKPLILFLHGFGERGGDPAGILKYGPFLFPAGGGELPATVVAPHLEADRHWVENSSGEPSDAEMFRLERFLDQMISRYRPDPGKISCTGLSMGGRGTYRLICRLPDVFSAAAVCCGRAGDSDGIAGFPDNLGKQKIWIFHGLQDPVVPPLRAVEVLEALLRANPRARVRLTLYPGLGHACYEKAYLNEEVYVWLAE